MRETLDQLLADFGTDAGMGALELDAAGYCGLVFDQKIDVGLLLDDSARHIRMFSTVGHLRFEERTDAYRHLLLANYFWQETAGGTLCLDDAIEADEAGTVLLIKELPLYGLDLATFRDTITKFVNAVEFWQTRLTTSPDQWSAPLEAPADSGMRV